MSELSNHIQSQYQTGEYDSEGRFTLNVDRAGLKLQTYGGKSGTDYLLDFLDIGMQARPTEMRAEIQMSSLSLSFTNASFGSCNENGEPRKSPEEMLEEKFHLPIQRAYAAGVQEIKVDQTWGNSVGVRITFFFKQHWKRTLGYRLGRLRGVLCVSTESKALQQKCGFSRIPILFDGQKINHPPALPKGLFYVRVGELEKEAKIAEDAPVVQGKNWTGAFALTPGEVRVIVRDITVSTIPGLGMSGYLYHRDLQLDISQQGLVRDANFETLLGELQEVKVFMLEELAINIEHIYLGSALPYLDELSKLANEKSLSPRATECYVVWMKSQAGAAESGSQVNHGARGY